MYYYVFVLATSMEERSHDPVKEELVMPKTPVTETDNDQSIY